MSKRIIFGRHGATISNQTGLLAGARTNTPLTDQGRNHAHELAHAVSGIELIVSSPLARALETAEIVATDNGYDASAIVINALFTERDFGSATNKPKAEAFAMLDNGTATNVETVEAFADRAKRALQWLQARPEHTILIVSHAAFGQMLATIAADSNPADFLQFNSLANGATFELTLE